MKVALHNSDTTAFPNLALMKLSAWHKARGDMVKPFIAIESAMYDLVYSSKIFSWTAVEPCLPDNTIKGGTGYGIAQDLPEEVEHIMPDYGLYPAFTASLGFTTRGCVRNCPWCVVPQKEGVLRPHANIMEFLRPDSREVVLMDNNILASSWGLRQLEIALDMRLKIDCNQGLDARIIASNPDIAKLLAKVRWLKSIRLACDHKSQMAAVEKAVTSIRNYSRKKGSFFCYVLVNDIQDALERVEFLRELGVDPFAQPYRPPGSKEEPEKPLKHFARWVNHKAVFKSVSWSDYRYGKGA